MSLRIISDIETPLFFEAFLSLTSSATETGTKIRFVFKLLMFRIIITSYIMLYKMSRNTVYTMFFSCILTIYKTQGLLSAWRPLFLNSMGTHHL